MERAPAVSLWWLPSGRDMADDRLQGSKVPMPSCGGWGWGVWWGWATFEGTPQRLGRLGPWRVIVARSRQLRCGVGGMGPGHLPCQSCTQSLPPLPPPLLLEPLLLLEQPPGPQHVSEHAEPAAQAPNTHPPHSHSLKPTSRALSQTPAANLGKDMPLPVSSYPTPQLPTVLWEVCCRSPSQCLPGACGACKCTPSAPTGSCIPFPKLPMVSRSHPCPCSS